MRAVSLAVLGTVAYAVFAAATIPARFVAAQVEAHERNRVRVHEAHGTLWHGAARVELAAGPLWVPLDNLAWRVRPGEILGGRLAFAVDAQAGEATAHGTIARGVSKWHGAGEATAPASFAVTFMPLLATWRPEGRVHIRTSGIDWDEREARGEALAEWRDAALALANVRPLGSYRAVLDAKGPAARIEVTTLDGALRVAGQGELAFPSRFTFNGEARGQGPNAAALESLLDLMGPRRPDGARTLAWRMN